MGAKPVRDGPWIEPDASADPERRNAAGRCQLEYGHFADAQEFGRHPIVVFGDAAAN
jgi:hypothetical protein